MIDLYYTMLGWFIRWAFHYGEEKNVNMKKINQTVLIIFLTDYMYEKIYFPLSLRLLQASLYIIRYHRFLIP